MENITPDGKIKTIRCVKATHEDFAKLVNLGKEAAKALQELEAASGYTIESLQTLLQTTPEQTITVGEHTKTALALYREMIEKSSELYGYHNAYHVLMEEGVNELLATIGIGQESYGYDFYQLCLEN